MTKILKYCLLIILSFCPSFFFLFLSFCHFVFLSFCLFVLLSFRLSVFFTFWLFNCLSFFLFLFSSSCLSVFPLLMCKFILVYWRSTRINLSSFRAINRDGIGWDAWIVIIGQRSSKSTFRANNVL